MIILTWITCCQKLYSYKVAKQNDDCFPGLSRQYICQVDILQQLFKSVTETVPLFYFSVVLATIFSTALRHSNCCWLYLVSYRQFFQIRLTFSSKKCTYKRCHRCQFFLFYPIVTSQKTLEQIVFFFCRFSKKEPKVWVKSKLSFSNIAPMSVFQKRDPKASEVSVAFLLLP